MTSPTEASDGLDPDDPRPASHQIANVLRAAIRTRKLAPGERLPSQHDLADRYGVARETVKAALRILRDERLIVTRQGSGAFVRAQTERPVGLRPHVEQAFTRAHVTIDFAGFSGETLHGALTEPLDKIRAGRLAPETIAFRILLPDPTAPMALPCRAETQADDPAVRERAERITRRHTGAIVDAVRELADLGLVTNATAQARVHRGAPLFKLYLLNGEEAFFGFYPVMEHTVTIKDQPVAIYDPMGKDTTLFHWAISDDEASDASAHVEQARAWFDSMWNTIAREFPL
jgi:DNA-binding transcriptional regulator YhcF (GntR family)